MNTSTNGAKTLAYMRGERDIFEERKKIRELRKMLKNLGLAYWLTNEDKPRAQRFWKVVSLLEENSRMPLTTMSKKLNVPVATLFDTLKIIEKLFRFTIVIKESEWRALVRNSPVIVEFPEHMTEQKTESEIPLSLYAQ